MIADDGTHVLAARDIATPAATCSVSVPAHGDSSPWRQTLLRAMALAPVNQVYAVVGGKHGRWWRQALYPLPPHNIGFQPHTGSSVAGILLPLLNILETDPGADIVIMPSNQQVRLEPILLDSLRLALELLPALDRRVVLLGSDPCEPDPQHDYVVPALNYLRDGSPMDVVRFVAKPTASVAGRLISRGALWNTSILAAQGGELLQLFEHRIPEIVANMRRYLHERTGGARHITTIRTLYRQLRTVDFSKDILQGQPDSLKVLQVPACTWMDRAAVKTNEKTIETASTKTENRHHG